MGVSVWRAGGTGRDRRRSERELRLGLRTRRRVDADYVGRLVSNYLVGVSDPGRRDDHVAGLRVKRLTFSLTCPTGWVTRWTATWSSQMPSSSPPGRTKRL